MKFKISSADCVRGIKLGLTTALFGIVLSVVPPIVELEKNFGLAWMFELRGPRPAPSEVVIVSIDSESARELGLEENPILWPRSVHAHLVKKLKEYDARVIVFDVFFRSKRELSSDQELAQEFSRAGNVILFAHLNQRPAQIPDDHGGLQTILMDQLVPPTQTIAAGALSYAPFPLPKIPARVNQTWLFKASSGDIPTIPVLAMHRYAARDFDDFRSHLLDRISDRNPGINTPQIPQGSKDLFDTIRRVRQAIQTRPDLLQNPKTRDPDGNSPKQFDLFRSLYLGPDNRYIDFYGPPQTIQTIPYYQIIRGNGNNTAFNFHDKAVFVGNSERYQPDLKDDFHTVFSEDNGSDLSGVEIMATVFANLLEGRSVEPIEWLHQLGLLAFWGLGIGALFYLAPGVTAIITAALLAAAYLAIAATLFERDGTWFSLVTPLLIQLPFALLGAMLLRYRFTHRAHQKIQRNVKIFLNPEVVKLLPELERNKIAEGGRLVEGVCLASDAESYTAFAQNLDPRELKTRLNRYYDFLFQPVQEHGGMILDVLGDSMLAFWENNPCPIHTRVQACHAALDIQRLISSKGCGDPNTGVLPTRIGLHAGQIIIGNVGAGDHFEFRAVGDMINTASRIEGLNKYLGTRTLVSAEVANILEEVEVRRVGKFRLKGKDDPLEIFELFCGLQDCGKKILELRGHFLDGLEQYELGRWREALLKFRAIIEQFGEDGPSLFYLRLCENYLKHGGPDPWDGVHVLKEK